MWTRGVDIDWNREHPPGPPIGPDAALIFELEEEIFREIGLDPDDVTDEFIDRYACGGDS